ncbi:MAG: hypothetical protein M0R51_11705 [Clostridia bacterium]|nr:hypothetical protein [Clostridia bacterium]
MTIENILKMLRLENSGGTFLHGFYDNHNKYYSYKQFIIDFCKNNNIDVTEKIIKDLLNFNEYGNIVLKDFEDMKNSLYKSN